MILARGYQNRFFFMEITRKPSFKTMMKLSTFPENLLFAASRAVAQNPFRLLKRIFDRGLSFRKLAILAQTRDLRPVRFTENRSQKFFNVRSRDRATAPRTYLLDHSRSELVFPPSQEFRTLNFDIWHLFSCPCSFSVSVIS